MIDVKSPQDCCGCSACVQRCPKHCISLKADNEGFLYPDVDINTCIDCGLCKKVCPMLNHLQNPTRPIEVYAAKNRDEEIRRTSSSGGVFSAIATQIIKDKGVVFGACFNSTWEVVHDYAETQEDLKKFQGSKYVQSQIGNSYKLVESFLRKGRKVLFSGTPCQISGLHLFLQKDYENLYTIDIICHGVPSPGIWREYLKEEIAHQLNQKNTLFPHSMNDKDFCVEGISFRDKEYGWKKYSFALTLSTTNRSGEKFCLGTHIPLHENLFMRGFLTNLYLRPSCYACPVKCGKSRSDLTLGDFWKLASVMPELDDDKGMTALLVNSVKGKKLLEGTNIETWPTDYESVLLGNPALEKSVRVPENRIRFFKKANISFEKRINKYARPTLKQRITGKIKRIIAVITNGRL